MVSLVDMQQLPVPTGMPVDQLIEIQRAWLFVAQLRHAQDGLQFGASRFHAQVCVVVNPVCLGRLPPGHLAHSGGFGNVGRRV